MGWQGDKLVEPFALKVVAQGVRVGGTDIDIPNDQGVLLVVKDVSKMVGSAREWFILGSVDIYNVHLH